MADNELKEMLQTVIQGELKPIHEQLYVMQNQFQGMENRMQGMQNRMQGMQDQMNHRFDELHKSIEASDRDSIASDELLLKHMLELKAAVSEKITTHDHHFNVVNNRLFNLESDVDRLKSSLHVQSF